MKKIPSIVNAVRAACRVVRAKVKGESVLLDEESVEKRLATCRACPFYDDGQCRVCTCLVELKAQLATERCPKGKWSVTNA